MNSTNDRTGFLARLSWLANQPLDGLTTIIREFGLDAHADGRSDGLTFAQERQRAERADTVTSEILDSFYRGREMARDEVRLAYIEEMFQDDYDRANALGIDRTGVSKIRKSGILTKSTRLRFDGKYGSHVQFPAEDEAVARGYLEAINYTRKKVFRESYCVALSREELEYLVALVPDGKWKAMLEGVGQVSTLVRYGQAIIGEIRRHLPHLGPPWRVTSPFNLAATTLDWSRPFLLAHFLIWEDMEVLAK